MFASRSLAMIACALTLGLAASPVSAAAQDLSSQVTIRALSDQQPMVETVVSIGGTHVGDGLLAQTGDALAWLPLVLLGSGLLVCAASTIGDDEEKTSHSVGSSAL